MALYSRIFKTRSDDVDYSGIRFMSYDDFPSVFFEGYTRLVDNPEFKAGVDLIADLVSNMTIMLMKNTEAGDERVKNGLSRQIDITPHPYLTRKELISYIVKVLIVEGNQITIPEYTKDYRLKALHPQVPSVVDFKFYDNGYKVLIDNKEYNPGDVLHFKINNKHNNPFVGESLSVPLRDVLINLGQASKTKQGFMKSKFQPPIIISVDTAVGELASQEGRKKILDNYIKQTEKGEPWLLPSGAMTVESVKPLTLKDIAINESVEIDKKTVASILGVPAFLLGVGEYNQEEYNTFINTTIMSISKILEQEMTRKLILSDEYYLKFNSRSLFEYSLKEKTDVVRTLHSLGLINGDEARDMLGFDPVGQKDYVMLENYIPKTKLGDQSKLKEVNYEEQSDD